MDGSPYQEERPELNLTLNPDQNLILGRVHKLPSDQLHYAASLTPEADDRQERKKEKYNRRVATIATFLDLPPAQEYLRTGMANFIAYSEQWEKDNSLLAKFKKRLPFQKK